MTCSNGHEVADAAKFCPRCGVKVSFATDGIESSEEAGRSPSRDAEAAPIDGESQAKQTNSPSVSSAKTRLPKMGPRRRIFIPICIVAIVAIVLALIINGSSQPAHSNATPRAIPVPASVVKEFLAPAAADPPSSPIDGCNLWMAGDFDNLENSNLVSFVQNVNTGRNAFIATLNEPAINANSQLFNIMYDGWLEFANYGNLHQNDLPSRINRQLNVNYVSNVCAAHVSDPTFHSQVRAVLVADRLSTSLGYFDGVGASGGSQTNTSFPPSSSAPSSTSPTLPVSTTQPATTVPACTQPLLQDAMNASNTGDGESYVIQKYVCDPPYAEVYGPLSGSSTELVQQYLKVIGNSWMPIQAPPSSAQSALDTLLEEAGINLSTQNPSQIQGDYQNAKVYWQFAVTASDAEKSANWQIAATNLQGVTSPNYRSAEADLKTLIALPDTGQSAAQLQAMSSAVADLDNFFQTPGVGGY